MQGDLWNSDWESFVSTYWNPDRYEPLEPVKGIRPSISTEFGQRFPKLSKLLNAARSYTFVAKGNSFVAPSEYSFLAWTTRENRIAGWICDPVRFDRPASVPPLLDHRLLLSCIGPIHLYWNEPDGLICNLDYGVFKATVECGGFGGREESFHQVAKTRSPGTEMRPEEYFVFAIYPNGDALAYKRDSGAVILIGFDASGKRLVRTQDYPDLIYTLEGVPDFHSWVETLADEYLQILR